MTIGVVERIDVDGSALFIIDHSGTSPSEIPVVPGNHSIDPCVERLAMQACMATLLPGRRPGDRLFDTI